MAQERRLRDGHAWGYRVRARLDYDVAGGALRISPSMVWNHDVDGVSMDGQLSKTARRSAWASASTMPEIHGGHELHVVRRLGYNPLMDRDYYSVSFGVNF